MQKSQSSNRIRQARRAMYRSVISEAAEAVFAEKGFADARMSDVALEAGISLKTLYQTFAGKAELFDEIRNLRIEQVISATAAVRDGPPLEVMMNRRHAENPLPRHLERRYLKNDRCGLPYENAPNHDQGQRLVDKEGNDTNQTADGQGSGVPHEHFRGMGIVP